jgi:Tfp pilus assembly protein PilV
LARKSVGFGLVESIVSAAMLISILIAVWALMGSAFSTGDTNRSRRHAVALAADELEDLRSRPYADLAGHAGVNSVWAGQTFTAATTVEGDVPAANMSRITVTISYSDRGRTRSYVAQTIYTAVQR